MIVISPLYLQQCGLEECVRRVHQLVLDVKLKAKLDPQRPLDALVCFLCHLKILHLCYPDLSKFASISTLLPAKTLNLFWDDCGSHGPFRLA